MGEYVLDDEVYHDPSQTPGLDYSGMKHLLRSPAHYRQYLSERPEPTKSMLFGRAVHTAILEPDKFTEKYICMDDSAIVEKLRANGSKNPRTTNEYKEWYGKFQLDNLGKETLDEETHQRIQAMVDAAHTNAAAAGLLQAPGETEVSFTWVDESTGVPLKARLDKLLTSGRIIDVKTCPDARLDQFQRSIWQYRYDIQGAVYAAAIRRANKAATKQIMTFICIETDPPHCVAVYELDPVALEVGQMAMDRCIELYQDCTETGMWPGYDDAITPISLPAWASKNI